MGTVMLAWRRPSADSVRAFLAAQSELSFTYTAVGATADGRSPAGYVVDRTRTRLGEGEEVFSAARRALERWDQFRLGWVEARAPGPAIRAGEVVAIVARSVGIWWLNACRIVYVVDEQGPTWRFGFGYGTLPG